MIDDLLFVQKTVHAKQSQVRITDPFVTRIH